MKIFNIDVNDVVNELETFAITKKQKQAIIRMKEEIDSTEIMMLGDYEYKQFLIDVRVGFVSVTIEMGKVNDEGTFGALLFRYRIQFFVESNGVICYISKGGVRKRLNGFETPLAIHYAQSL